LTEKVPDTRRLNWSCYDWYIQCGGQHLTKQRVPNPTAAEMYAVGIIARDISEFLDNDRCLGC
jgi:hypothetical protein